MGGFGVVPAVPLEAEDEVPEMGGAGGFRIDVEMHGHQAGVCSAGGGSDDQPPVTGAHGCG